MSKYTTEVRFICERASGLSESAGFNSVSEIISGAVPKVFNFDFPIFDENYRNVLCTKILRHYYTREICEETVGLWKLRLETRLNEIMPYYNQLYRSELLEFNPLYDTAITTENNGNKVQTTTSTENESGNKSVDDNGTSTTKGTATSESTGSTVDDGVTRDLYSDTPQGSLQNVENEEYLTNARKVLKGNTENTTNNRTDNTTGTTNYNDKLTEVNAVEKTGNVELNSTDKYIQTVMGKSGSKSYSEMLEEFRKTFLNIDVRIINDLADLFFCLW